MAQRTCTVDGCERKHMARGLCGTHYNQRHQPGRHKLVTVACGNCGAPCQKRKDETRFKAQFCTLLCRDIARGARMYRPLPKRHPVMLILNPPKRKPKPVERTAECEWCGSEFTTTKPTQRMCTRSCKVKALKVRRRGREAGSPTFYTWTEVMRLFLLFDRCCAYCEQPIDGQPDPDHVVPLSRGGSNSITNILPSCQRCNSDKRDLLLSEWNADRKRRGLPPVRTCWALDDPRVQHLTLLTTAA